MAQLVEHHLAKVRVAGSSPVIRSGGTPGGVAEWLGKGLQNPPPRFNSGHRLQVREPHWLRAYSSAGERFPDTEEVTGSIPVTPTTLN